MVAYSFNRRFIDPIWDRTKSQSIRNDRKRHARPGETLQLYVGMRTKRCQLVGTAQCIVTTPIRLDFAAGLIASEIGAIRVRSLDQFARSDGFANWDDMRAFWYKTHGLASFRGVLVRWDSFQRAEAKP